MQSICLWTFLDAGACSWGTFSTCCHNWVCFFSVVILFVMLCIKLFLLRYGSLGGHWNVGSYNFSRVYVAVFSCAWFALLISDPDISLFAFSLNLHFEARLGQRVWITSISSSFLFFSSYNWYLAILWFNLGATCLLNSNQICSCFSMSSVSSNIRLFYVSIFCYSANRQHNKRGHFFRWLSWAWSTRN